MLDILEYYNKNLGYKNVIFKYLGFRQKTVLHILRIAFVVSFLIIVANSYVVNESVSYYGFMLGSEIIYLVFRSFFTKKLLDKKYGLVSKNKVFYDKNDFLKLESELLNCFLSKYNIKSRLQVETYSKIVLELRESSRTKLDITFALAIALCSSLLTLFFSKIGIQELLSYGVSSAISIVILCLFVEKTIGELKSEVMFTKYNKYSRILQLIYIVKIRNEDFSQRIDGINKTISFFE